MYNMLKAIDAKMSYFYRRFNVRPKSIYLGNFDFDEFMDEISPHLVERTKDNNFQYNGATVYKVDVKHHLYVGE